MDHAGIFGSPFIAIDGIGAGDLGVGQVVGRGKREAISRPYGSSPPKLMRTSITSAFSFGSGRNLVEGGLQRCQSVRKPPLLGIAGEGEDKQISRWSH